MISLLIVGAIAYFIFGYAVNEVCLTDGWRARVALTLLWLPAFFLPWVHDWVFSWEPKYRCRCCRGKKGGGR